MDDLAAWLRIALLFAGFARLPPQRAEGACVYQGSLFENNTIWKPDSCQECRCHRDILICEPAVCKNPRCDFQKGEVLRIAPNTCCPECASGTEGVCQHEGQTHAVSALKYPLALT
ncbi:Fraser extracellular matrix complex subunit 1 [Chelydra serpentina]|uniref:Fraser extracellular matrix complex subunit 1 n=1 Tax=Chelydra serpentina TaxID=8475 RepID=A0A8T1STH3_CHESE|nr:Fraser extracellular matrix complex subunit 1 [Chelydra serpentina]